MVLSFLDAHKSSVSIE